MTRAFFLLATLGLITSGACAQTWESEIAMTGPDGSLVYTTDAEGNRIPDFSYAGYRSGTEAIPDVPTVQTLSPASGDDTARIQAAIDAAEALTPDARGLRGAVELAPGTYEVNGTLTIDQSGVVLRGAGDGEDPATNTILTRSGENQDPVIYVGRIASANNEALIRRVNGRAPSFITDEIVPVGAMQLRLANPERARVGSAITVFHPASGEWLDAIDGGGTRTDPEWQENEHPVAYARTVVASEGDVITLDAPIFYRMERSISQAYVYARDDANFIREVGIEDLRVDIQTTSAVSETQARNAIEFALVEDGWVSGVTALHFWHAGISIQHSRYVTVQDCEAIEPHSIVDGGRRYNFEAMGSQLVLFRGNRATDGRHAYAGNGQSIDSGIVFLDNSSEDAFTSSEAHRQWSSGFLYDNHTEIGSSGTSTSDRRIHLGNRGSYGSSHGWACANCVVWNAKMNGALVIVEKPPTAQNYAIGVQGNVSDNGPFFNNTNPYIEGTDRVGLNPRSLYLRQLEDRQRPVSTESLGPEARLLLAPAPNPSRSDVRLGFHLATPARLAWRVIDARGRTVAQAPEAAYGAGEHRVPLATELLPAGTYWFRVQPASASPEAASFTLIR